MKIHLLDSNNVRPLKLQHIADDKVLYKGFAENFDFGLRLQTYNVTEGLRDRKTNFNTAYFLSDLKSLSSVMELDTPYTFNSDSKFTTYIKYNDSYLKSDDPSDSTSWLYFDTNFNALSSEYFFTFNLSTNELLYITKEYNNTTYYAYCSSDLVYLSSGLPPDNAHLFRYNIYDNKIKLFPNTNLNNNTKLFQLIHNTALSLSACSAVGIGNTPRSVFDINRNNITALRGSLNNTLSFYLSSFNKDSVGLNLNTSIGSLSSNFLMYTSNYTLNDYNYTLDANIIPLKNQATLEEYYVPANHFNSQPENLNRQYEKIFSGNNDQDGYDKIYLSYNIGTKDIHFPPSKMTYFTTPSSLSPYTVLNINDSKIDYIGATPGNNPLLADKVFKRRLDIKNNNFSDAHNATYLCSWLSGNENGDKLWVDRYYNPDFADFSAVLSGTSFYNTVTASGLSSTYVFDVSSSLTFEPNNDYAYYHIGERDYEQHLISLEKYLLSQNIQVLNNKGAIESVNQVKNDIEIDLDGDRFGKFITNKTGDFSFSFWLSAQDFTQPLGYKILGNYFEEGFGIFNTELVTPNIYLPSGNKLILLNNDFEIYDEIEIQEEGQPVTIKGIARKDNFSEFYVLGENNVIYIYNSNPNLISKITDLSGVSDLVIDDIEVTNDRLYVSFNPYANNRAKYFSYNFETNETVLTTSVSSDTYGSKGKMYVNNNGGISFFEADNIIQTGNELATDSNNNAFVIKQKYPDQRSINWNLIYKNFSSTQTIELTGGSNNSTVTNVIIDEENYIYTLYDTNRIAKLKNTRELVTFKELNFLSKSSKKYIDLIYDFEGRNYKRYILIIENLTDRTLLHKLDFNFNLIKTKSLGSVLLNNLKLTKSVTSYNYLKKQNASKNRFKVLLKPKPLFTKTGAYKKELLSIDYDISQLENGYNHFAVNVSMKKGYMELYVNGYKYQRLQFSPGKYSLDNPLGTGIFVGALSTPYNLTLANRLLQRGKYFLNGVKIKGLKMYDRPLDYYEIKTHINYHTINKDTVWALPVGQRVYIDTIDRVFKFNLPEKNTNTFDIFIKNLGITNREFQEALRDEIEKEIPKIVPYYDQLREIVFTTPVTPDRNFSIQRLAPGRYLAPKNSCIITYIEGRKYLKFTKPDEPEIVIVKEGDSIVCGGVITELRPYTPPTKEEIKECPPGYKRNPKTGACELVCSNLPGMYLDPIDGNYYVNVDIQRASKEGSNIIISNPEPVLVIDCKPQCPSGTFWNPDTQTCEITSRGDDEIFIPRPELSTGTGQPELGIGLTDTTPPTAGIGTTAPTVYPETSKTTTEEKTTEETTEDELTIPEFQGTKSTVGILFVWNGDYSSQGDLKVVVKTNILNEKYSLYIARRASKIEASELKKSGSKAIGIARVIDFEGFTPALPGKSDTVLLQIEDDDKNAQVRITEKAIYDAIADHWDEFGNVENIEITVTIS